ncbi:hydroxyisourate hydrolase [Neisseria sp. Ec49-e6-T10]|uniref:hydroxyisourate hydrolase n=1 Tax=Neisseria sp. Ec49-e6-T10 TaxID=3140744 RepID=UPI003EB7F8A7
MKYVRFLSILFCTLFSLSSFAADNPLSVHVLNTQNGLPSSGVEVKLEQKKGNQWILMNEGVTNEQGRITALYPQNKTLENGIYRVTFAMDKWFKSHNTETFFPEIPVVFNVDGKLPHYHIPLLISPYGFSTYRGN